VSDWLNGGGGAGEVLEALADACPEWTPEAEEATEDSTGTNAGPNVLTLADIEREEVTWLWPGRIPFGKLVRSMATPAWAKRRSP